MPDSWTRERKVVDLAMRLDFFVVGVVVGAVVVVIVMIGRLDETAALERARREGRAMFCPAVL